MRDTVWLAAAALAATFGLAPFGLAPFGLALAAPAGADQCGLKLFASVDMIDNGAGAIMVPVTLNGRETAMFIDTGAFWSGVALSAVPGLTPFKTALGAIGAGGGTTSEAIRVPEVRIGPVVLKDMDFLRLTEGFTTDRRIAGNIGANILKQFDVEIDQAARKVNFLSKDHCKGKVVHWPHSDLIDIPLDVGKDGLLSIPVTLDGKELTAMIDTGASASELRLDVARDKFGLSPGSPGMDRSGSARTLDGALLQYEHRFETLSIENITFKHPVLMISEDRSAQNENARRAQRAMRDEPHEMLLGMHQLRQLHLYFAYDEERLYATSVAGDAATAGPTAQAAAPVRISDPVDMMAAGKLNGSAMLHANAKEFTAALSDLDQAIALAPRAAGLYNNRAIVYAQMGNPRQAIEEFGQAIQIDPKFRAAYLGRANLYLQGDDTDSAIADLTKAIEIKPLDGTDALTTRCRLYAAKKDFHSALFDCNQAVTFAPRNPAALEQRGLVYLATGTVDEALDDFDAALNLDARRAPSLMGRGLIRQRKGDAAGARADIAAAREIDPSVRLDVALPAKSPHAAQKGKPAAE